MEQGGTIETDQRHEMNHDDLHEQVHSNNRSFGHGKQNMVNSHLGSTANSDIWRDNDYHDGSIFSGNQYNAENHHSISPNFSGAASSGMFGPYMLRASSSSTNLFSPWHSGSAKYMPSSNSQTVGVVMDGYSGNSHFTENTWAHSKQKNVDHIPGYIPYLSGAARSDISSPVISQGSGTSIHPEHRSNGNSGNPQGFFRNATQSFPCAINARMPQVDNNIAAGGRHGWDYTYPMPISHGMGSISMQRYKPVRPPAHLAYLHYSHEGQQLAETVQLHDHIGYAHTQIPAPFYQYQLNNMEPRNLNTSNGFHTNPRLMPFTSSSEQVFRPNFQLPRAYEETIHRNGTLFESAESSGFPLVHEVGNANDELQDMRIDIDSMSYEELLALEEQIGNVNTGLTEEFISKNMKTCTHAQELASSMSEHEPCVICQVEYKEGEKLGALNCGHTYHSCCIRQWLLIKNLCPICKTTALANA